MNDEQVINCNVVFVWDEKSEYCEEIILCPTDKNLMIDTDKEYEFVLREVK